MINKLYNLFLTNNMMSRDWIDFLLYINNKNKKLGENILNYILINIELKPKNIDKLIISKNYNLLKLLNNSFVKTSFEGKKYNIPYTLFSNDIIKNQLDKFYPINLSIINIIKQKKYNIVIDGANVLYSSKLIKDSYNNLSQMCNSLEKKNMKPLIILHKRHYKNTLKYSKKLLSYIVFTPYKENDDNYIIYASLLNQSQIITCDSFTDHIYEKGIKNINNNFLKNYFDEKILKFSIYPFLLKTGDISKVNIVNNNIFIPSINFGFIKISKNY